MNEDAVRAVPGALTADPVMNNLVGESQQFRAMLRMIRKLAGCEATVLIQGETGTGKELAARAIHYLGARRDRVFIPVNCGAIPETLVESELFGHARGAFTDAREAHAGLIAQAEGGTLLLDEVEAMGMRAQVALLRVLQDRQYRPVGASGARAADVRVIAASNVDLMALVERREFRSDLLFRLNVLVLDVPPLRARGRDVVLLAESFARRFSAQYGMALKPLHPEGVDWLLGYHWPGNVRELENLIHRQVLLGDGGYLDPRPASLRTAPASAPTTQPSRPCGHPFREAKARAIAEFERSYIVDLLASTHGNLSLAARVSGKERSRLGRLVKKYGLVREQFANDHAPT